MALLERSYNGQLFRPKPVVHFEPGGQFMAVATSWGPRSVAKKVIQTIQDYLLSARADTESTSPFSKLTCLSPTANLLRVAVFLANDAIYSEENKNEYVAGVELFAMTRQQNEITYVQVGSPQMLVSRMRSYLHPLGSPMDLSCELSLPQNTIPPLPAQLLGLHSTSNFSVHTIRPQPGDRLILVSRSLLPGRLFQLDSDGRNLDQISDLLIDDNSDLPFWLGTVDL